MHGDAARLERVIRLTESPAAAQKSVDTRQEDCQLERLGDIIVATNVQTHNDIGFLVRGS